MRLKQWAGMLAIGAAVSVLLAPSLVLFIGLRIRGPVAVPGNSVVQLTTAYFVFGLVQFGLSFLAVGIISGGLSALGAGHGWVLRVLAVLVPTVLLPFAADRAIVWSNQGVVPIIQDTRPYFVGSFPVGCLLGMLTLLAAIRMVGDRHVMDQTA